MIPAERFSNRVDDYVSGRPGYPDARRLLAGGVLRPRAPAMIADVGAGTGISAGLLISHGFDVVAVEPNDAMRNAAIARLGSDPQFRAVAAVRRSHDASRCQRRCGPGRAGFPLVRPAEVPEGVPPDPEALRFRRRSYGTYEGLTVRSSRKGTKRFFASSEPIT